MSSIGVPGEEISDNPSILQFLMSIPASSIDVEFQSLCRQTNALGDALTNSELDDEEGIELLGCLLASLSASMRRGMYFEVLQAYIYRLLVIYTDVIVRVPRLSQQLTLLQQIHFVYTEKFRHMLQSNLCLLKMLCKMPSI
jgi:hypothetical protein